MGTESINLRRICIPTVIPSVPDQVQIKYQLTGTKMFFRRYNMHTWVILHHDRGHAPVTWMVGVISLSIGVTMHVGHVPLVLC